MFWILKSYCYEQKKLIIKVIKERKEGSLKENTETEKRSKSEDEDSIYFGTETFRRLFS